MNSTGGGRSERFVAFGIGIITCWWNIPLSSQHKMTISRYRLYSQVLGEQYPALWYYSLKCLGSVGNINVILITINFKALI